LSPKLTTIFRTLVAVVIFAFITIKVNASPFPWVNYTYFPGDTIRPIQPDRYGDPYTYPNRNPFNLKDTGFIKRNVEYDPVTKQYYII
jgi:hypothetical protein